MYGTAGTVYLASCMKQALLTTTSWTGVSRWLERILRQLERGTWAAGTGYLGSWNGVPQQLEQGTSAAGTGYLGIWNGVPRRLERIPRQLERGTLGS
jgi:hypothetical protein